MDAKIDHFGALLAPPQHYITTQHFSDLHLRTMLSPFSSKERHRDCMSETKQLPRDELGGVGFTCSAAHVKSAAHAHANITFFELWTTSIRPQ